MKLTLASAALAVLSACLLAGCTSIEAVDERPKFEPVEVVPEPPSEFVDPPAADEWRCSWDATMDDDWHNDYVCTNGVDFDRPYLIPGDSFVERWEIEEAATAYELQLNS